MDYWGDVWRVALGRIAQGIMRVRGLPGGLRLAGGVLSLLPEGVAVLRDRSGTDYFVHFESHVGNALLSRMWCEPSVVELAKRELNGLEAPTIVDVGANAGTFSLPLVSQAERVTLVEADSHLTELLRKTIDYNGLDNVEILNCAVTNAEEQEVSFYRTNKLKDLSSLKEDHIDGRDQYTETQVKALTLEEVLETIREETVDLLKIDIEGMTSEAILSLGCKAEDVSVIIAEPDEDVEEATCFLEKRGFSASTPLAHRTELSYHTRETLLFRQ